MAFGSFKTFFTVIILSMSLSVTNIGKQSLVSLNRITLKERVKNHFFAYLQVSWSCEATSLSSGTFETFSDCIQTELKLALSSHRTPTHFLFLCVKRRTWEVLFLQITGYRAIMHGFYREKRTFQT